MVMAVVVHRVFNTMEIDHRFYGYELLIYI